MKNAKIGVFICFIVISPVISAGDIATERTQAATAAIIAFISDLTNDIKDIVGEIEELEAQASRAINELQAILDGTLDIPVVNDIFQLARDIEAVIEAGEGLAYTANNVETQMRSKFQTYDMYLSQIRTAGSVDELQFENRFKEWSNTHRDTVRNIMAAHGFHSEQIATEERRLDTLSKLSTTSEGRMQALQAGHQIAIEEVKQLNELQTIIMEQSNLHAEYFAMKQAMEAEEAAVSKFRGEETTPTNMFDGTLFGTN